MHLRALVALGFLFGVPVLSRAEPPATLNEGVRHYRTAHTKEILEEFSSLLSIPNTKADADLPKNAAQIVVMLEKRGLKTRLLREEGAPPAVYGELDPPGAVTTLGIYAHYDGQPVDARQWSSPPFKPTLRVGRLVDGARETTLDTASPGPEWRLYARGSSDDKAPIEGVVVALDALHSLGLAPSV